MKSEFITETLSKIEQSINSGLFIDVEKSKVELKDLSTTGDWKSLNETICAFLNTDGGIVVCGVREKDKKYYYKGFNRNNESKLIDLQTIYFKDDNDVLVDVSDSILFDYFDFDNGEVAVIAVYPLSDDKKFVKYNNEYYQRKLTQDRKISPGIL